MENNEKILCDRKLCQYLPEDNIKSIAELFSNGSFNELISTYFKKRSSISRSHQINNNNNYNKNYTGNNKQSDFLVIQNQDNLDQNSRSSTFNVENIESISSDTKINNFIFDTSILDKMANDKFTQQILLTVVIYSLLQINENKEAKVLIEKYINVYKLKEIIFPLILLKSKYLLTENSYAKAIDVYSEAIHYYTTFDINKHNNTTINIETYDQEFIYFNNLFNYLFALNNLDSKIKKLYYELKYCLYAIHFYSQGYISIIELYNKYPNDFLIQFEITRDSILLSKYDKYKEFYPVLKKSVDEEKDENKKYIYMNHVLYVEGLFLLAQDKYEEAKACFTEILKNDSTNVLIINNLALLNIYKNRAKETYDTLKLVASPDQMDSANKTILDNINILMQKYYASFQKI